MAHPLISPAMMSVPPYHSTRAWTSSGSIVVTDMSARECPGARAEATKKEKREREKEKAKCNGELFFFFFFGSCFLVYYYVDF